MTRIDGAEDLLVLARQNLLAEDAERRFDVAVQSSRELDLLYRAGVGFDAEAQLTPDDQTRSALLVERTLAALDRNAREPEPRVVGGSRYRGLVARALASGVLFGLLLSVALASAWEYAEKRLEAQHAARAAQAAPATRLVTRMSSASSEPSAAVPEPAPPERAPSAAFAPAPAASVSAAPGGNAPRAVPSALGGASASGTPETAAELFARANQARRSGDIEAALAQYRELCALYPTTVEAEDAKVLIGKLLLSQRSPRAALRELDSYRGEALADEALWARAEALRKLGSLDERAALLELVRRHSDSPYAEAARKRLLELEP